MNLQNLNQNLIKEVILMEEHPGDLLLTKSVSFLLLKLIQILKIFLWELSEMYLLAILHIINHRLFQLLVTFTKGNTILSLVDADHITHLTIKIYKPWLYWWNFSWNPFFKVIFFAVWMKPLLEHVLLNFIPGTKKTNIQWFLFKESNAFPSYA